MNRYQGNTEQWPATESLPKQLHLAHPHTFPLPCRAERLKRAKQRQREWLVRLYCNEGVQEALGTGKLEAGCNLEEALAFGSGDGLDDAQVRHAQQRWLDGNVAEVHMHRVLSAHWALELHCAGVRAGYAGILCIHARLPPPAVHLVSSGI